MQTTLLTIAIAIILALVTALVGPLFFPFSDYRGVFEAEASRLTGLPVRILGPIDARLLPTPILTLKGLEIGPQESGQKVSLRALRVEFGLGPLVRGELRASELHLDGPEITAGLDKSGRLVWLPGSAAAGINPDSFSVEHVDIEDGRVLLTDAASGANLALENVWFKGDMRSLAGPVKGEGGFNVHGLLYPYTVSVSRPGDDGASKFRLSVLPIEPERIRVSVDGSVSLADGQPNVDASVSVHRPVGSSFENGRTVLRQPWQLTGRVKGDSAGAAIEQIEYTYGPEERAIRLKGDAKAIFGAQPRLKGALSSPQIDLDRALDLPDDLRRKPLAAIKTLANSFSGQRLPIPLDINISTEMVTLAGASLQRASGDVRSDGESFDISAVEFRAPGFTQVRLSGRLSTGPSGTSFSGPVRIDANDPRTFIAWLSDRTDLSAGTEPLRLSGDLALGNDAIAIERLKADLDRIAIEGRAAYRWAAGEKPARLDAALRAPEVDVDRALSVASAAFGDVAFDWPREGTLELEIGRATVAGIQARDATVKMWLEASGLMIERLAVADFGGASLTGVGRLDTGAAPRGTMTFDLDASRLDGTIALLDKAAPRAAGWLRRAPGAGAKLHTTISVDDGPAGAQGRTTVARFTVDGRVGDLSVTLAGGAAGLGNVFKDFGAGANARLEAKIDADDGNDVVALLGLGRIVAVGQRPGQLRVSASGQLNGEFRLDGQVTAAGLDMSGQGTARLSPEPKAALRVDVANADLSALRPAIAGRPPAPLPVKLKLRAALDANGIALDEIDGAVDGTPLRGKLALAFGPATRIDGAIDVGTIDLPAVVGTVIGMPQTADADAAAAAWPADPFTEGVFGNVTGRIAVRSARVRVTPRLTGSAARGTIQFGATDISVDDVEAVVAGGRATGRVDFHRDAGGLTARGRFALAGADAAGVLPGGARPAVTGKLSIAAAVEGTGLSPAALIGSLTGNGTFKLETAVIAGLDARVFDTVSRSIDQGLPLDTVRVGDRASRVMAAGRLQIPRLEGNLTVGDGQLRVGTATGRTESVELAVSGGMSLSGYVVDGRVSLSPTSASGPPRPEITVNLKGQLESPQHSIDVSALVSWLALRAVERQAQRLQELQSKRIEQPDPQPTSAVTPAAVPVAAPAQPPPTVSAPAQAAPALMPSLVGPSVAPVMPPVPYVILPAPSVPPARSPALPQPAARPEAPPLPPAIDIRPAPQAGAAAPRADAVSR